MHEFQKIRDDFPILEQTVQGRPLVYLDNAATTQKPRAVIERLVRFYETENANIHRGVYDLSQRATSAFDEARAKVARFINAAEPAEILFTRGTTEGINLVASTFAHDALRPGDQIIVSAMEHHSNIVPWQLAAEAMGARLRVIPMNDRGELDLNELRNLLTERTRIVAVVHVSNSLGTINDVKQITELAHAAGAAVLIDGAQWVAHHPTDVRALDCDFYAFSGHKLFGPTGTGVLYGKRQLLEGMAPYHGGGDMIESVTFEKTTYAQLPNRFEAGTPHIAGIIGLGAAIDYLMGIGFDQIMPYERKLLDHATQCLAEIPGLRMIGAARNKAGVISFVMENPELSSLDVGLQLDAQGIAVRTGHHCCQPVMDRMGVPATARASFAMYNTVEEIDALAAALQRIARSAARKAESAGRIESASGHPAQSSEVRYPKPSAASPEAAAEQLAEVFDAIEEKDEKNEYVLEMGAKLPHYFNLLKQVSSRVPGCMSEVYIVSRTAPGKADVVEFVADANSDIVRGLIVILQMLYSGQSVEQVLKFDIESFFRRIGLDQFITTQRRNGLAGMVQRIRASARALAETTAHATS